MLDVPRRGNYIFQSRDGVCIDGTPRTGRDLDRKFSYVNVALWSSEVANARMDKDGRIFATRRLRAGEEIFFASYGPNYDWRPVQRALVRRAIGAARQILANSVSETAAQIRRMEPEPYLYDLVRNRASLGHRAECLAPTEGETPRRWFVRAFSHPVFSNYCTFRKAGAPGEKEPDWPLLLHPVVTRSSRYNLRVNPRARSYAENDMAMDLSGSMMLADDSQESPGVTVETGSYLGERNSESDEEDEDEDEEVVCIGLGDPR